MSNVFNDVFGTGKGGKIFGTNNGSINAKLEKWEQGVWEDMTGKTARTAGEKAAKQAEMARREAIVKQFGEKQQADNISLSGMKRGNKSGNSANGADGGGFIGSGFGTSSGTF